MTDTAAVGWRVARRALTVLGGTVAGIAIAWGVSAACASAETPGEDSVLGKVPAVDRLAGAQATRPVVQPLSDVARVVERVAPVPPVADLEDGATRAADDVGQQLAGEVHSILRVPTGVDDAGGSDLSTAHPAPGGGASGSSSLVRPGGDPPAATSHMATGESIVDIPAARGATERGLDGMTGRGSPEPAPGTPFGPGTPAPAAVPVPVPGSGSSGPAGGGTDSPTAAALRSATDPRNLTTGRVPPAADAGALDEVGTAPGVTPD